MQLLAPPKSGIVRHAAGQLHGHPTEAGAPLRLADVKYGHRLKRHLGHFHLFCNKLLGLGIQYVLFYRNLVRAGSPKS